MCDKRQVITLIKNKNLEIREAEIQNQKLVQDLK